MKIKLIFCLFSIVLTLMLLVSCGECKHEFGEWETVKEATCVDSGIKTAMCSLCQLSKTKTIDAGKHSEITLEGLAATCTETGLSQGTKCSLCNEILTPQSVIEKTRHDFVEGKCSYCGTDSYSEGLLFMLNSDNASYKVSLGDCNDERIVIPESYNGLPVTLIETDAFKNGTFVEIYIPNSILTIESGAFTGCKSLSKITIPFVGKSANATSKEALFGYIFGYEEFDESVKVSQNYSSLFAAVYYIPKQLTVVELNGNLTYGAFCGCANLTTVIFPKTVTTLPDYSFYGCSALAGVTLHEGLTEIGNEVFGKCSSLTSVSIPASVKKIGEYVFYACSSIKELSVPANSESFTSIDGHLYSKDESTLVAYALGSESKQFIMSNNVKYISSYLFFGSVNLESIVLSNQLTSIPRHAFSNCSSLKSIIMSEGVTIIKESAFLGCSSLESIQIPSTVEIIESYAFQKCTSLKTLSIGKGVKTIEEYAFSVCSSLVTIYLQADIEYIGKNVFWKNYNATIYCEDESLNPNWDASWNPDCKVLWDKPFVE